MKYIIDGRIISSLITANNGRIIMHLFYEFNGATKHLFSENNVLWEELEVPDRNLHFSSFTADYTLMSSGIAAIATDGSNTIIIGSNNSGKTWGLLGVVDVKYHRVSASCACLSKKPGEYVIHLMTTSFMQTNQTYITFKMPSGEIVTQEKPFPIENYGVFMPQLWCYNSPDTKQSEAKVLSYVWAKPDKPRIYATDTQYF
jgi:hypothetical protein